MSVEQGRLKKKLIPDATLSYAFIDILAPFFATDETEFGKFDRFSKEKKEEINSVVVRGEGEETETEAGDEDEEEIKNEVVQ